MTDALYRDVDLLSLDAGNTIIFLDHARLEALLRVAGFDVNAAALVASEGAAKRALSGDGEVIDVAWAHQGEPGARSWGRSTATLCALAGVPRSALGALLDRLWASHVELNLYSKVPEGFVGAMRALRASGVKVVVVSNSEGMLEKLFAKLAIRECFDVVVDSGIVGVEKPDPRIFQIALDRTQIKAVRALHVGDIIATDIDGARNAGMRAVLVDPFGHYLEQYPDVPRAAGVVAVSEAILRARS